MHKAKWNFIGSPPKCGAKPIKGNIRRTHTLWAKVDCPRCLKLKPEEKA
jgi:hypothetical protein